VDGAAAREVIAIEVANQLARRDVLLGEQGGVDAAHRDRARCLRGVLEADPVESPASA